MLSFIDHTKARAVFSIFAMVVTCTSGCACSPKSEVIVMGMIHGGHRTSDVYGVEKIKDIVQRIDPDYILCEIPPGRMEAALAQYRRMGKIVEPRVRVFPEYVDAIIPLMGDMKFQLVPCAAWTKEMADDRQAKLEEYKTTRPDEHKEMQDAIGQAVEQIKQEGGREDPLKIHTDRYDELVKQGMEPYVRLFNDDLGPGGWDTINAAHYALIAKTLDEHKHKGKRFLITFGSWHKYWFLEKLRLRKDIKLINLNSHLEAVNEKVKEKASG